MMTPTTLQALRRLLFFSRQEAAQLVAASLERPSGVSDRAWRQWEAGEFTIPSDVIARLRELLAWRSQALDTARAQITSMIESHGEPEQVTLIWYGTLRRWMTLPGRTPDLWRPHCSVVAQIAADHAAVRLVEFDEATYFQWLRGRPDSETTRSTWAAEQ